MKKGRIIALALTVGLSLGLVGCGSTTEISYTNKDVNVYTRDTSSGTREGFFAAIGASNAKSSDEYLVSGTSQVTGNGDMINKIKGDEYGIGYISLTSLDGSGVKGLNFNGVEATEENVLSGDYEMSRYFSYVTIDRNGSSNESKLVNEFLNFLNSRDGINVLINAGVIVSMPSDAQSYVSSLSDDFPVTDIKIGGSTSCESAAKAVTAALTAKCPAFNAVHAHTGSGDSEKVITASSDMHIGFSSSGQRSGWETDEAQAANVVVDNLGQDAIVVVVNSSNPLTNITTTELQEVYVKVGATHNEVAVAPNTKNISKWDELIQE